MGGDPTCVPPDFNTPMVTIWDELWESMPQSGSVSVTVKELLRQYKERCQAERKKQQDGDECPLALLPVSFALAKDWLRKKQKIHSQAIVAGAVNESAREVVVELSRSLTEQSTSTAHLLEQTPCSASPVIPPPQLSLGPEPVTDKTRAQERREHMAQKQREHGTQKRKATTSQPSHAPKPKKPKAVPPEMEERQQRAQARMLQLGVTPVDVSPASPCVLHVQI